MTQKAPAAAVSSDPRVAATPPKRVNGAPITFEAEAVNLPIAGELPRELNGTLFRNGPNPQFPVAEAHLFGGDGMLHAFQLENGRASYRNRWVRTAHFVAERAAGRGLFNQFGRPKSMEDESTVSVANEGVANTNIVWHAGKLLALEELHAPIEVDPATLATVGPCDFGGAIGGPFTAHPKTDPRTGELLFFGYSATGPLTAGMRYGTLDKSGRVTRFDLFEAPYASMVHDFAVTDRHVVFPVMPLTASMPRVERGGPAFAWEPELGSRIGVMPRNGRVEDIRWFEGDAGYVFHVMNAWDERDAQGHDRIVMDVMQYEAPPLFPFADGRPGDPRRNVARLCRWTFDLDGKSNGFTQQPLDDLAGEFPRIDERFAGSKHRHGWYACQREPIHGAGLEGIAHVDATTGKRSSHFLPPGDKVSEPVFVPRGHEAPEGDGWLLATVYRAAECRSDLAVFNALSLVDGPIATVQMSHRVPSGFHGNWLPAAR